MSEKKTPSYDLDAFKIIGSDTSKLAITRTARRTAQELGFDFKDIADIIETMQQIHFYKSMTAYANSNLWQDVYHVPSEKGILYVKFTADTESVFVVLSFKERDDE